MTLSYWRLYLLQALEPCGRLVKVVGVSYYNVGGSQSDSIGLTGRLDWMKGSIPVERLVILAHPFVL